MTDLQNLATQLAAVAEGSDLNSRRAELNAVLKTLVDIMQEHAQVLRNLQARVDQLETRMAYVDPHRGC